MRRKVGLSIVLTMLACVLFAGCITIGPGTMVRDRFDYTTAISDSWKSQMLLNMVKVRYGDTPVFLDIASVISQYTLSGEIDVGASANFYRQELSNFQTATGLIKGGYIDRPTITYSPLTGKKFAQSLIAPIPLPAVFNLIESGYPVDIVFRICLHSINGAQNSFGGASRIRPADPEFFPLLAKMRQVQASGDIALMIQKSGDKESTVMYFRKNPDVAIENASVDIRKILGLDPTTQEFKVTYGSYATGKKEIAILTRSMLEIITDLSSSIEVPSDHVAEKRVYPTPGFESLIHIHSSAKMPADAFVAVPYHDYWFWIDDKDFPSKRMLTSILFMFSLTETGDKEGLPIVTVSTN